MNIVRRHDYKVFKNGLYLGLLPNVTSEFEYTQEINTPGSQIDITVGQTLDTAPDALDYIETESGEIIYTENEIPLTTETAMQIVGDKDSGRLIANNNDIQVWEYSDDYPNGVLVFTGYITRLRAVVGREENLTLTAISNGVDFDDYIFGNQSIVERITVSATGNDFGFWAARRYGQTFTTVAGQTDIQKIILKVDNNPANARVFTLKVWNNTTDATLAGTPLASVSVAVNVGAPLTEVTFAFVTPIPVLANTQYFFSVELDSGSVFGSTATWGGFDAASGNIYTGGALYQSSNGDPWSLSSGGANDMYFRVFSGTLLTDAVFTGVDPSVMVKNAVDGYLSQGGGVSYTSSTVDLTALSLSYTFKLATILEIIEKARELAPTDWYWYVDPATKLLYFKAPAVTATHKFILGRHFESLEVEANIEDIVNVVYVSGGLVGGTNLLKKYTNAVSLATNRLGMKRISDNRITVAATAEALADGLINENSDEVFLTDITIHADTYDVNTIKIGDTVGLRGTGTFIDSLILQITRKTKRLNGVDITLGKLPIRQAAYIEDIKRDLEKQQTVDNPSSPS